ncbi:acyl-CoA dehydrogenase family protein [Bradyrhizobium manausense]|jgi:acyl-CoA dehydrogenase|uniref:acyl-CoA dehydrogenase family protein n=2 Tax=Pseudomonadota TaxID=1224 RepID=UPI001BA87FFC|nr:acyl-CoA dehydrogenase family protein [Bradyrhizobium manausense]MBR1087776.1 acyl-CoA dehydrogenase family protein [Bradyrhizobium manausense]
MSTHHVGTPNRSAYFGEEHELLRAQLRRFVEEEIKPHALKWEQDGMVPREVLRRMGELGFLGIRYPAEYGGSDMDTLATVVLAEELGRSSFSGVAITVLVHTDMASVHLYNAGSQALKDHFMPDVIAGKKIVAVGVTEPGAGSDVKGIRTTARRDGGSYVLNGAKMFITNGVHADLYCIAANTNPDMRPSQRISMLLVEKGTPGFRVGRALDKQGWRSSDTAELLFEDCRIPATNLLGEEGRGFYAIMRNFQNERIVIGAMAMGEALAAIEITLDWVTQRQTFGAPLWSRQAIRHRLAMLAAKVEAGRQLVYHAAWLVTQGIDATKEVSMVKAYCGELVNEVMYTCLQFHGGMGYMRESTIERMSRDARVQSIGGGATEVMLEEVAKRMR